MFEKLLNLLHVRPGYEWTIDDKGLTIRYNDHLIFAIKYESSDLVRLMEAPDKYKEVLNDVFDCYVLEESLINYFTDSGQGKKYDSGKLRYDLSPVSCIRQYVEILTYGANKYNPNNWQKVETYRYYAAALRHIEAWRAGEKKDEESGFHHLAHAICNLVFMLWQDDNDCVIMEDKNESK